MGIDLDSFMSSTETGQAKLVPSSRQGMQYPFLYMNEITNVEIKHLIESGILCHESLEDGLPLFLKHDGYRLLGYVKLNFDTILHLNYLREHEVFIKASKDSEMSVTGELFENILLTR